MRTITLSTRPDQLRWYKLISPGPVSRDAYRVSSGHDAWVLGDDPFVALKFESKSSKT
jgi:hypothetical protein